MTDLTEAELRDVGARWEAAMRAGHWEAAWQQTDRIELPRRLRQREPGFVPGPQHLRWDGTPLAGRSVLVRCLHGLGDTLQFMRFVPQLASQASELHFLVQPSLLDLLQSAPGLGQVSNAWTDHPPPHEVEIEVMELAYALRSTPATVPPPDPRLSDWVGTRQVFVLPAEPAQRRVGLLWAASDWDPTRSIPLEQLEPLLSMPGVRWFDLQQGEHPRDPRMVPLWRQTANALAAAAGEGRPVPHQLVGLPHEAGLRLGDPPRVLDAVGLSPCSLPVVQAHRGHPEAAELLELRLSQRRPRSTAGRSR